MIVDIPANEIKRAIRRYLSLPYEIRTLKKKINTLRVNAYASQSFTGVSKYGHSIDDYQHAVNVENFVIELVMIQDSLNRQLERVCYRYKRFCAYYPQIDLPTVKTLIKHDILTDYEIKIYHAIQKVNSDLNDYDKEHAIIYPQQKNTAVPAVTDEQANPTKSKLAYLIDYLDKSGYTDETKQAILDSYTHKRLDIG